MKKTKLSSIAVLAVASALMLTGCPREPNKPTPTPGKSDPVEVVDTTEPGEEDPTDPEEKDPEEKDPEEEATDLISTGEIAKTHVAPNWAQITDGVEATNKDGKLTFVIPVATFQEWQAQIFLKTNASVEANKCYEVSYKITPTVDLVRYTCKFDETAEMVYKNDLTVSAEGKVEKFYIKPTGPVANITFVYDFGGNEAVTVEIADLVVTEITQEVYDEATYVPPVSGTKNEVLFAQDAAEVTDAWKDDFEGWYGDGLVYETATFDGRTVKKCSSATAGGCYGVYPTESITFKAGAKLQATVYSDSNFKFKPVAPDAEMIAEVTPKEWTTVTLSLGEADGELKKIGIIFPTADQVVYISDLRIVDNE